MDDNTLKARRRLRHSTLPETAKYPIILNAKEPAARLLLEHAHCRCMHLGTEYVRNYLQQKFLIIGLRQALKQIRHRCFFCRRLQGKGLSVFRSDLPSTRFQDPNENPYPFKTVGIDYIGPFHIAENSSTTKQYICLFTCFTIRALHLETTESLTTDSCVTALRTFIARRGSPQRLLSDNATYFIGAKKQLRTEPLSFDTEIASYLHDQNISWKMNLPSAPHLGGGGGGGVGETRSDD